ncbi:spermine oxidase-like [Contarinia nasturtii]|uniref:spermine oxidase-like n=1 Tax=Contarinia nasturtii TaxID=265458 RepID=UPI0012D3F769|nr:spermine oxidase-like [Contarinia nasturtii]XP_031619834.1 spermine oxidase-like [Contarinia nasturtii]
MDKKIVIIGAGPSGVAAATKLMSNGFSNVTILEAGNRIGGRINTISFGANVVDMGAQWCHGEKNNVVYELAKGKNVLAHSTKIQELKLIQSDGTDVPIEITKKLSDLAFDLYDGDDYDDERSQFNGSVGNFFAKKYNEALKTDEFKDISPELAHQFYDLFHELANSLDGANSWYETSCNSHEYEDCEGDRTLNWKDKGYVTVFDLLQNKIPGGDKSQPIIDVIPLIQFNKEVMKIAYNQPDGLAKITCKDGSSYSADHVICTVSLGVLKERCLSMFEPLLPRWKYNSIDGMMIGTVDKIYLEFDKPFWSENWEGFSCLWNLEQLKEVREDPVNGDWLEGINGFYPVNPLQPNLICGWVTGDFARKMEEKSDEDVKTGAEKILRQFLKHLNIPDATKMIRSTWYSNPLFRGSYSCYTLKAEALEGNVQKLAEPINDSNEKPIVQFAGEATSTKHYSCVHGAIESGWREADRLINFYK